MHRMVRKQMRRSHYPVTSSEWALMIGDSPLTARDQYAM